MVTDRYGSDVLAGTGGGGHRPRPTSTPTEAHPGLVVEDVDTGWVGAVVRVEKTAGLHVVVLEDRRGRTRSFPLGAGFWVDGRPVELRAPRRTAVGGGTSPGAGAGDGRAGGPLPGRTASGSVAVPGARARVARAGRIWVEGRHDAELVEKVWGDDLRIEGVVVEMLDGVDHLPEAVAEFGPADDARLGVLVDHLVPGSKEERIARAAGAVAPAGTLLVLGHPYVDVWQAVRPERLGLDAWPVVERGRPWKEGVLEALGWPSSSQADVARGWQRILGTVRDYRDLEPTLLGRVEELIDFVTG